MRYNISHALQKNKYEIQKEREILCTSGSVFSQQTAYIFNSVHKINTLME